MNDYKLYIIVRSDMEFSRGKLMVHAGHIGADIVYRKRKKDQVINWMNNHQTKIILKGKNKHQLTEFYFKAWEKRIICSRIEDIGKYQTDPDTLIMIGILCNEEEAKELGLKKLSLFR